MSRRTRKRNFPHPPFERRAARWQEEIKPFKKAIYRSLSLQDRTRWMRSAPLTGFRVFSCGYYAVARGHVWERRNLDEGVCIYCVDGRGEYHQAHRSWSVNAGDLLYCFPGTHHRYAADATDPWTIHWMHVSGRMVDQFIRMLGLSPEQPVIPIGIHLETVQLFQSLFSLFQPAPDEPRFLAIQTCAQHLLARLAVVPRPATSMPGSAELRSVVQFMMEHLNQNPRLADFADYLGVSVFHFSRRFKAAMGLSPMDYFKHLKIQRACSLLAVSPLKTGEIARQLGFVDPGHFSRLFKNIMGAAPEHYRQKSPLRIGPV